VSSAIGDRWLVEDGLAAGERVVTEGLQKIRPGVAVAATEAGAPPGSAPGSPPAAPPGDKAAPAGPPPAAKS
jgi:membrane fusion protein, multidrug efflux system